jgi:hypothetical protein
MTATNRAETLRRAISRDEDRRAAILRDIEERVQRCRSTGTGFPHLAHNLAGCVAELAAVQATIETLQAVSRMADE